VAASSVRVVHLEASQPPPDAASEWYSHELTLRGVRSHFDLSFGLAVFSATFRAFSRVLRCSPATEWGLPVVDRMAWKRWRTPPPYGNRHGLGVAEGHVVFRRLLRPAIYGGDPIGAAVRRDAIMPPVGRRSHALRRRRLAARSAAICSQLCSDHVIVRV
jgi:hypothetical protein